MILEIRVGRGGGIPGGISVNRHRQEGARRQNGIGQLAWPKKRGILVTKLEIYSMGPNHGRSYI